MSSESNTGSLRNTLFSKTPGNVHVTPASVVIAPAALPEVGLNAIKLPPADCHFVAICRIHCNRRFVRSVADDVVPLRINIHLVANEGPIRRDHPWRRPQPVDIGRRHVVFFEGLVRVKLRFGCLSRSGGNRCE